MPLRIPIALIFLVLVSFGCDELAPDLVNPMDPGTSTPTSPPSAAEATTIQAVGSVTHVGRGLAAVEMAVMTETAEGARYVGGVANPRLVYGGSEIPLLTTDQSGIFITDSSRSSALRYEAGAYYEFLFDVVDAEGTTHSYHAIAQAPSESHEVDASTTLLQLAGEPLEIELLRMSNGGIVRVAGPDGALTWTSLTYTGPGTARDALASLQNASARFVQIPGEAFPVPGNYTVEVLSLGVTPAPHSTLTTANFLAGSWFAVGSPIRLEIPVE